MTEHILKIIGWTILVLIVAGIFWSIFRNKEVEQTYTEPIKKEVISNLPPCKVGQRIRKAVSNDEISCDCLGKIELSEGFWYCKDVK